jgi:uncharacterized protein YndB with AHSA1/START domain
MPDIMHLIKIAVSPDRAYQAVATAEGIRNWWTRDTNLDSQVGGTAEFGFYGHRFVIRSTVDSLTPSKHVGWTNISSTHGGFDGTTITFDLCPDGSDTVLSFAHRGFKQADGNYAGATTRWGYYLFSLQRYLESGKGSPNPEDSDFRG